MITLTDTLASGIAEKGIIATTEIDDTLGKLSTLNATFNTAIDRLNRGKRWNSDTQTEEDLITKIDLLTKVLTLLVPTLAGLNIQENRAFIYNSQEGLPQDAKAGDIYIYLNGEQNYPFSVRDSGSWEEGNWTTDDKSAFWVEDTLYYIDNNAWKHDISCTKAQYNYVADLAAITELYKIIGQRIADLANVYVQSSTLNTTLANYYDKTNKVPVADVIVQSSPTQKTQADVNSELATAITEVKDMTVEEVENPTNNTITAELNKYYHILSVVNTLNIKLPVIEYESSDTPAVKGIMLQFRTGDNPNISVSSEHWIEGTPTTISVEDTDAQINMQDVHIWELGSITDLEHTILRITKNGDADDSNIWYLAEGNSSENIVVVSPIESGLIEGKTIKEILGNYTPTGDVFCIGCDNILTASDYTVQLVPLINDEHIKYFGEKIFRANTLYEVSAMHNGEGWYIDTNYDDNTPIEVISDSSTTSINLALNKYYRITFDVTQMNMILPVVTEENYVEGLIVYMNIPSTYVHDSNNPLIKFTTTDGTDIMYFDNFAFDGGDYGRTYELNCTYNGNKWIISYGVVSQTALV